MTSRDFLARASVLSAIADISLDEFQVSSRTGLMLTTVQRALDSLIQDGLVETLRRDGLLRYRRRSA